MWNVDVDVLDREIALVENRLGGRDQNPRGELEDLAAVHLDELLGLVEEPGTAPRQPEIRTAASVGAELEAEEAARVDLLQDNRPGAVAEQDERRAIVPVEDLGQHVSADDERAIREPGREHRLGLRDRVDEACATGREVVGGGVRHAERVGEERRRGRKRHIGRDRRNDEQVDRRRLDLRHLERAPAGGKRDVGEGLVLARDPALADARTLADPFVVRVDERRELVVREHTLRHMAAEAGDRDRLAVRAADHGFAPTANVSVPRTASSPSTVAFALPRPTGPRTVSTTQSSVSVSPGRTTRLNLRSSMPAKSASFPWFSGCESTATAPHCASASTILTPGMIGLPGKWPAQSSSVTVFRARTRSPGTSSSTSSIRSIGSRCGSTSSIAALSRTTCVTPRVAPAGRFGRDVRSTSPCRRAGRSWPRSPRTGRRRRP